MPKIQTQNRHSLFWRLAQADIPYAVIGALAVEFHGAHSFTDDRGILLTESDFDLFRRKIVGQEVDPIHRFSRRFVERTTGKPLEVFLTGHSAGRKGPTAVRYPDPRKAGKTIEGVQVLELAPLIELKLAANRYYDSADVVNLIRVHKLDESFLPRIHPSVYRDFIECLEEKRREDEYEAREEESDE